MALYAANLRSPGDIMTHQKALPSNQEIYINRELSWLQFNQRVLEEARSGDTPLLERLKFLAICYNNLDEFFMVRVSGKKRAQAEDLVSQDSPDQRTYSDILKEIHKSSQHLLNELYDTYEEIIEQLAENHIRLSSLETLNQEEKNQVNDFFSTSIHPILTPLAVDPAHPFPFLSNLGLYLLVEFESPQRLSDNPAIAFVEVPHVLERFYKLKDYDFLLLEDIISSNLSTLFWGLSIKSVYQLRVTRDLDYSLLENEVVDLLKSVQHQVKAQEQAAAVRLEISDHIPNSLLRFILESLNLSKEDVYFSRIPLCIKDYMSLAKLPFSHLKFEPFNPRIPTQFKVKRNIFSIIRDDDILLHHPFESFYTVIEFLRKAATDPKVLAIKQTLYRTSGDSPIINALKEAAENGKHVTAVVELKARFDEKNNIIWARLLERSGVNVVYGFIGLKTHAKATLVVRKEDHGIRRYTHLSTGNYNSTTAKLYTDIGLITADEDLGYDITNLFNLLTGFNIFTAHNPYGTTAYPNLRSIVAAPVSLRKAIIARIDREIEHAKSGLEGLLIFKVNAIVDKEIIDALYKASQNGVSIRLMVRGICCLRPGIKNFSDNIEVKSIVDRFLEHSRIYYFHNQGNQDIYLSSADLMPRNLDRRIEIMFPIKSREIKSRITQEILDIYWRDNVKTRLLHEDGSYRAIPQNNSNTLRAQRRLIDLAREQGLKSLPYEKAIWHNLKSQGRPIAKKQSLKRAKKEDKANKKSRN